MAVVMSYTQHIAAELSAHSIRVAPFSLPFEFSQWMFIYFRFNTANAIQFSCICCFIMLRVMPLYLIPTTDTILWDYVGNQSEMLDKTIPSFGLYCIGPLPYSTTNLWTMNFSNLSHLRNWYANLQLCHIFIYSLYSTHHFTELSDGPC